MFVEIKELTKIYGGDDEAKVTALDNVSLSIAAGEFVVLMGPSGSGKSTFLHLLGGLDKPTSGSIIIDGEDITKLTEEQLALWRRTGVGFVFQSFNLIPVLSAKDNVRLPLLINGQTEKEADDRACELLKLVGLSNRANHKPAQLSGGQQQRTAIARAMAAAPSMILADEPTGALDSSTGREVTALLRSLAREIQQTVVVVTHNREVARFGDRIIQMEDGAVLMIGDGV